MKKAIHKKTNIHSDNLIKHEEQELVRINKYISSKGIYSRRDVDRLVTENKVLVNGVIASLGTKVNGSEVILVDGKSIETNIKKVYIMLNKPTGITSTTDLNMRNNIRAFVDYKDFIYPIGRLDKDSSGLILLTNDGDIVNKILRAEEGHEKEYVVTVNKDITDKFIKGLSNGVLIYNQVSGKMQLTKKCKVTKLDNRTFKIVLQQGLNRQIRRMTEAFDYEVKSLRRIRVMNIKLGDLRVGEWRYLNDSELKDINKLINQTK